MPSSNITVTTTLLTSPQEIQRFIENSLSEHLQDVVNRISPTIKYLSSTIVRNALLSSPEYGSLLHGELREAFGLEDASSVVDNIIYTLTDNIEVRYEPPFDMVVEISRDDFQEILSVNGSSYISNNSSINWLEWLLTSGDSIIITSYHLDNSRPRATSRTGSAVMVPQGTWRVPPQYSGTSNDNWITRAISSVSDSIIKVIQEEFIKEF